MFIVHHSEDVEVVKRYVIDPLQQEPFGGLKVECVYDATHFMPGRQVTAKYVHILILQF